MKIDRNNTDIMRTLNAEMQTSKYINDENKTALKNHQYLVKTFLLNIEFHDTKGMLLYHEMGTGKSILSISIAIEFTGNVVLFMNSGIIDNYKNEIRSYLNLIKYSTDETERVIETKFTFISLNSYNLSTNIPKNLKNTMVIIDEAHHLFSGVVNGSLNSKNLYYALRGEPDVKILLLSGTPIYNDPYEIVICLNILSKHIIFPESYNEFTSFYLDIKDQNDNLFKHRIEKLENRIVGMVSYYKQVQNECYPEDYGIELVYCDMLKGQLTKYNNFKKIELDKAVNTSKTRRRPVVSSVSISKTNNSSEYKVKTRMICNTDASHDVLSCIKFNKIYENVIANNGSAIIYSQFINDFGLMGLKNYLLKKKYTLYSADVVLSETQQEQNLNTKHFAIISGDVSFENRTHIQNVFNDPRNANGELVHILLISSTGIEGLNFKCIRTVHILEPYWNISRIDQIRSRAIRYKSHISLPRKEQNVHTFIYLTKINNAVQTTDEVMYSAAVKKQEIINIFLHMLKRVSIDCFFNFKECYECSAINKPLFRNDYLIDIQLANPCKLNITPEIEVVHLKNDTYYDEKTKRTYVKINSVLVLI